MSDRIGPDHEEFEDAHEGFRLFVQMAAAIARDADPRGEFRAHLDQIVPLIEEEGGLTLSDSLTALWEGERDPAVLTKDLSPRSAEVMLEILDTSGKPTPVEVLAGLPDHLRESLMAGDVGALADHFDNISEEEQTALFEQFVEAGFFGPQLNDLPDMDDVLDTFDALLVAVAEIAKGAGDDELRTEVLAELQYMAKNGIDIIPSIERIWNGDRDLDALTKDLDDMDGALVARVLDLIAT